MRSSSITFFLQLLAALGIGAISLAAPTLGHAQPNPISAAGLANPASNNCVDKGGKVVLEKNGSGGQYGICLFPDNLQCEEWAMMRGDCRTGGIKVAGFVTPAARYCAITGGAYKVGSGSNTPKEQGSCTFRNGSVCPASAYFDGKCAQGSKTATAPSPPAKNAAKTAAPKPIRAIFTCDAGKKIDATFVNGAYPDVTLVLSDGRHITVPQTMSASGARYASGSGIFVFWNKGDTAFIEENGKTTFSGCKTKR